jgi:diacylglycerol kinase family enzyme
VATVAARIAVSSGRRTVFVRRQPPQRPVLVCNPRSGGGKVSRFGLDERARAMGVEVVVLEEGDDLEQLARDAVDRGADCLGMAGGDGSQALVAAVAVDAGLPFVCVAAGTRNHFALDLGLDREDPVSTLGGFTSGLVRRVDYATVRSGAEERLFVNNVSMGVYATVVQQDSYRDNKAATAAELLPELLGSQAEPFDLSFDGDDGQPVDGAFVVMVSNNPYILGATAALGQRPTIDSGRLGVFAMSTTTGREAAALLALSAMGARRRSPQWHEFTTHRFEVRSRCGTAYAAIDGEALELATPLEFRTHPCGLLVMVPEDNPRAVRRLHRRSVGLDDLLAVARGEGPAGETAVVPQPAA